MDRREFVVGAAVQGAALTARPALANVPSAYDWNASPPRQSRDAFVEWMVKNRGENPHFLGERFDRFHELIARHDVWDEADMRAFLLTPREEFVTAENLDRASEWRPSRYQLRRHHHRPTYGRAHDQHARDQAW